MNDATPSQNKNPELQGNRRSAQFLLLNACPAFGRSDDGGLLGLGSDPSDGDRSSVIYKPLASGGLIEVAVKDLGNLLARRCLDMHPAVVIVARLPACKL